MFLCGVLAQYLMRNGPPKVLQDLFHPGQVLPDPEFKPLDLQLLQREDDIQRQKTRESGADSQATDFQAGQS
jgi:hypothetical protein